MKQTLTFIFLLISIALNAQIEKPVHWKFSLEPLSGNEYNLVFTATIDKPWHMYANDIPEGGPIATSFNFKDTIGYMLKGGIQQYSKKEVKFDPNFNMKIGMFDGKATFKQKIEAITAKPVTIKGFVEFMACNDNTCLAPEEVNFTFDIPAGKGVQNVAPEEVNIDKQEPEIASVEDTIKKESFGSVHKEEEKENGNESLWALFFTSLFAGFGGLLTPCVYPMIPMTVSFFMRGQENRGKSVFNALIFGFSIIFIYTSLGGIVSLTGSGSDLFQTISTHWLPNLLFFLLFMVFAISFLGLFELVLPASLTNKMDQQADKGGMLAPFFMAVTLVLVSFSCTGPIVSSLLIEASRGAVIRPTVGMFAYSLAFALPFTLFAIFPGLMKNLPKSGGWLNSVKIFFAFILLAWGLKFISNIDQSYHLNLFTREVYIGIWIVLFTLLGLYLLGKIKFAHDSDLKHVGVMRIFIVITVFSFVLYLVPGLFGAPLTTISGWLPPKTTQAFDLSIAGGGSVKTTSGVCNTPKYSNILKIPYGIEGYFEYEEALACAKEQNKPLLIDFNGHSCTNCKLMENKVWPDKRILEVLKTKFIVVSLYIDDRTKLPEKEHFTSPEGKLINTLGKKNAYFQLSKFESNSQPYYVVMDHNGNAMNGSLGLTLDADEFLRFLNEGAEAFSSGK